jgi:hypothetical protein
MHAGAGCEYIEDIAGLNAQGAHPRRYRSINMKSRTLRMAGVALVLAAISGQALAGGYGGYRHGGGYYHGGHGYSHGSDGWVLGGALALLAAGTYVAINSEPSYAAPVYAAPPVAYGYPAPVYAAPVYAAPPVYAEPQPQYEQQPMARNDYAGGSDIIAYPTRGQNANQQARDRRECNNWAENQSGFNPAHVTQYTTSVMADSYSRAIGACMNGRGYSLN